MNRSLIFYILTIAIFGSLLWLVFDQGTKLEIEQSARTQQEARAEGQTPEAIAQESVVVVFLTNLSQNIEHPLSLLLLHIATIVVFSRLLGFLFTKIGQPLVIGEIIAGIILGPSLLGFFWPGISNFLFQPDSLPNLQFLSQLGLILFMFIVGLELDVQLLKNKAHTAVVVSQFCTPMRFPFKSAGERIPARLLI